MCATCGCESHEPVRISRPDELTLHHHHHSHEHLGHHKTVVDLELDVLSRNNAIAKEMRAFFLSQNIFAVNLVSSPGSGKTTLLERTVGILRHHLPCAVIEGDQQTSLDADRIRALSVPAVQINTGRGCHLDAEMIRRAVHQLSPARNSMLFIENVGNLVCPAMFDLGESARVVIMSVTEGDDKPAKYPDMFHSANLCVVNKIDLLPYVNFNMERFRNHLVQLGGVIHCLELSATRGDGIESWINWLRQQQQNSRHENAHLSYSH